MKKILLVEDDPTLAFMITDGLESEDFEVLHFSEAEAVMEQLPVYKPDIVLLDVNLKGEMNGFDLSKKIRLTSQVPVIFITSRTQIQDLQEAYKIRNIDYLKKPFGIRELVLRINELMSRSDYRPEGNCPKQIGNSVFSPAEQLLEVAGEKFHLQKNESAVLGILIENKGQVVTKRSILEIVWNDADLKSKEASLNNIIMGIRKKLKADSTIWVETIPKTGYQLVVCVEK